MKLLDSHAPLDIIKGFFLALGKSHTYLPNQNLYLSFGILWGIPIFISGVTLSYQFEVLSFSPWGKFLLNSSLIVYPFLVAIVFGAIGTMAKEQQYHLNKYIHLLEVQADTDGLTGLYNHRYFQMRIREEIQRAAREEHQTTLILADIDYFKRFNDTFGHPAGDKLLKEIAQIFTEQVRGYDIVCRYGGEEFVIILPNTSLELGLQVAERLRSSVETYSFLGSYKVTISSGVSTFNPQDEDLAEWIQRTDQALYAAKEGGRNAVKAG